jgi:hypothetical protein
MSYLYITIIFMRQKIAEEPHEVQLHFHVAKDCAEKTQTEMKFIRQFTVRTTYIKLITIEILH